MHELVFQHHPDRIILISEIFLTVLKHVGLTDFRISHSVIGGQDNAIQSNHVVRHFRPSNYTA